MAERTDFELTFTFDNNQVVRVKVDYEEDWGMAAINALRQIGGEEYLMSLISTLRDDASVADMLQRNHLGFDDDDEEW